jgi:putative ABC transport system ATP-binding protein
MDECRSQGTTLLFVSHDTSLGPLFDRVLSLADLNRAADLTGAEDSTTGATR